jgi:hypothetical protein
MDKAQKLVAVAHTTTDSTGKEHWHGFVYPVERHSEVLRQMYSLGSDKDMENATGFDLVAACEVAKKMREEYSNIQNGNSTEPGEQEQPKTEGYKRS